MSTITQRMTALSSSAADTATSPRWRTTESNRGNRLTEASQCADAVDGTAVQSRIDELQRQLAGQQAEIQDLQERLEHAIEITRDKRTSCQHHPSRGCQPEHHAAAVAGRRRVGNYPERADVQTGHRGSWPTRRPVAEVIDEVAQPKVHQATADEIFLGPNRLDARRTRRPVFGRGRWSKPRWPDVGCGIRPVLAPSGIIRDNGGGLGKGLKLERADVAPQDSRISRIRWNLSQFREGGRALRKTWARPAALERARGGPEGVRPVGPCGRITDGPRHTDKPPVASGRGTLGSGDRRPEGLEADPIRLRVLHARRPLRRSATARRFWRRRFAA